MKNFFKLSLSLSLCMVVLFMMFISSLVVQAKPKKGTETPMPFVYDKNVVDLANKYSTTPQIIDNDTVFLPLSEEDNIKYIVETNKIDYSQAEVLLREKISKSYKARNETQSIAGTQNIVSAYSIPGAAYEDVTGIILKRFYVVSGVKTTCTVVAAINVLVRIYWEYANEREFLDVLSEGVTMAESSVWTWVTNSISAKILSDGFIHFNASGSITGQISWSLSATYKAAGFTVGSNYNVNKFQTVWYNFDPDYSGAYLQ